MEKTRQQVFPQNQGEPLEQEVWGPETDAVIRTILERRSVRAYRPDQISDRELGILLECALYAPTGGNLQNSRFLVIQDPVRMEKLNRAIRDELASREIVEGEMMAKGIRRARQEGYHFIFHAPTLISAVAPRNHSNTWPTAARPWKISRSRLRPWGWGPAGATSPTG